MKMKNKLLLPILTFLINLSINAFAQQKTLTADEVVTLIKDNVNCDWSSETVDTFKAGNPEAKVTGVATTFLATLDVLKKAKAAGCNLVITHEPTFYNHFDEKETLENSPVQKAKIKFIEENDMVVFRFHDHWHRHKPDGIYKGVVEAFSWKEYQKDFNTFKIPKTTLKELALFIADTFNSSTVRFVGDPDMELTNVGMVLGAAGRQSHFRMLEQKGMESIIIGEVAEWETVEYIRDANAAGIPKGLVIMGHADSEEAGMEYCADWLKEFVEEVPVKFIEAGNPLYSTNDFK